MMSRGSDLFFMMGFGSAESDEDVKVGDMLKGTLTATHIDPYITYTLSSLFAHNPVVKV